MLGYSQLPYAVRLWPDRFDALLSLVEEVTNQFQLKMEEVIENGGVQPDIPISESE